MTRNPPTLLAAAISLIILSSVSTDRHDIARAADAAEEVGLDEVVVTARKREENLRDVPVSIGVLDGAAIDNLRVQDLEDVTRILPGISFASHQNGPADKVRTTSPSAA